jgi:PAS domain S-box-containing protein
MIEKIMFHIKALCFLFLLNMIVSAAPVRIAFCADHQSLRTSDQIAYSRAEKAWLLANHTVRIRIGHFPPLMFDDKDKIRGIAIDYIEYLFNRHKINFQYVRSDKVTWPNALDYIKQHKVVDMVPTAKITEERREVMIFTHEYIFAPLVIFTRKDDFISSIEDLKGKTISVEKGFVVHQLLKNEYPEINLLVAKKDSDQFQYEAIDALVTNRSDAYIGNLIGTSYIIQQKGYTNLKVAAPSPFDNHNQAMAIRNDWPELQSIINKTLDSMSLAEHKTIQNKWLSISYEYGIQIVDVLKWVLLVILIAIIVLSFILIWNRRLQIEIADRKNSERALRAGEEELKKFNLKLNSEINERKRSQKIVQESENKYRQMFENNTAIKLLIDPESGSIVDANQAAINYYGYERQKIIQMKITDINIFPPEKVIEEMRNAKLEMRKFFNFKHKLSSGQIRDVEVHSGPLISEGKNLLFSIIHDITERKQAEEQIQVSLKEKETLLHEIHHRVKNNMQVISSLLELQKNTIEDKQVKEVLMESQGRVHAMAIVHETLHNSDSLSKIDLQTFLSILTSSIFQTYSIKPNKVSLINEVESIPISINQASPLGLIINELISNSLKYAFSNDSNGVISVSMKKIDNELSLIVSDDGVGMPEDLDWRNSDTLGLKLIRSLVESQLDGSIEMESINGTKFIINFNIEAS